jgi:hypothetical protein
VQKCTTWRLSGIMTANLVHMCTTSWHIRGVVVNLVQKCTTWRLSGIMTANLVHMCTT